MRLLLLSFLITFWGYGHAQDYVESGSGKDSVLIILHTTDGNYIFGLVLQETRTEIKIRDFNGLMLPVKKEYIKSQTRVAEGSKIKLELSSGNMLSGTYMGILGDSIKIQSKSTGIIKIPLSKIDHIRAGGAEKEFVQSEKKVFNTRYFLSKNAYQIPKNDNVYRNTMVLLNRVDMGVSPNVSIGLGGLGIFPILSGKVGSETERPVTFGAEVTGIFFPWGNYVPGAVMQGMATFGGYDKNISLGLWYGYEPFDFTGFGAASLSGILQVGKSGRHYLISDNILLFPDFSNTGTQNFIFISTNGFRSVFDNSNWEFGLMYLVSDELGDFFRYPLPMVSYAFRF